MRILRKLGMVMVGILLCGSVGWAAPAATMPEDCWKLRLHGKNTEAADCFQALTRSKDAAWMAEGYWGLAEESEAPWDDTKNLWEQANNAFRAATSQPGAKAMVKVRWGMLLHERFNNTDSADLFNEALQLEPGNAQAYLGLAMVSADSFSVIAREYAAKAIAANPNLAEAHAFMANLDLEDEQIEAAVKEADAALALAPDELDTMALHAAADLLQDQDADAEAWLAKIQAVNAVYSGGDVIVGRHLVLNRRYPEGVAYYRKAVAANPRDWGARSELGINLMRMGEQVEAREQLELAYDNGQTDKPTSNSLKLLDLYPKFVTTKDATTTLMLWQTEDDLLRPYFEEQLHKAIATYSAKYRMQLSGPVQLEVYPDHEDFAVRTMGMPGLGALGVTFGNVVAMDSPSGRRPGDFNWGATMWHEMSHVFILSATNYRVPRWFTEGLAVHEEGQANPLWANRLTPEVVEAIRDKKLLPVAQMDQGFIFPEYPEQVVVSYWQAGTILDYIAAKWGNDAVLGMVRSFAALKTTPEAIEANLHVSPEEFDRQYAAWLDKRVGKTAANFDAWRQQLKLLVGYAGGGDNDKAITAASAVIQMYPEYVEDANAYEFLATAQIAKGNKQAALDALKAYETMGGSDPKTLERLASLEEELGRGKDAAATLQLVNFIYPEDQDMHRRLGELLLAQGDTAGAVREYSAVLAMNPLDRASAHYDVAKAELAAGDKAKAEESVLASLEAAPGYKPAQKLLLEIEGK